MRVLMNPGVDNRLGVGGISTVIRKWAEHFPDHGVELVEPGRAYDVEVVHAGYNKFNAPRAANVACLHGMYWTAEQVDLQSIHYRTNSRIIQSILDARVVTVPSPWVATTVQREFGIDPFVVPHGVDLKDWEGGEYGGYVLWAKNIGSGVCDPGVMVEVARRMPDVQFIATYGEELPNLRVNHGAFPPDAMREMMLGASVWLATAPETFGVANLEAMAAGKPIVAVDTGYTDNIRHGFNGYLAEPGDIDSLVYGIRWALRNVHALGKNSRYMASKYTWDAACVAMIEAMQAAEEAARRDSGVTFVIPAYNKADTLETAVASAVNQVTKEPLYVIVVDDASTDDTPAVMERLATNDRVRYIRLPERSGVSHARNVGIQAAFHEYIVTLDADDRVSPDYVETCLKPLRHDPRTGVVYTGLGFLLEDGTVRASDWPGEFDINRQRAGHNTVPSCAMFRKEVWRRVGGFRGRYNRHHLLGYGSEDAAFWLHAAMLGFNIRQVTTAPLFHYRNTGGTKNPLYTEVPWHTFFNWDDGTMPIGAPRPLEKSFVSVRTYAPTTVSVIIPVGPGHERYVQDAIDSVVSQSYYKTEIIVVWDTPEPIPEWYKAGYSFVKWVRRPKRDKKLGAGAARNLGADRMDKRSRYIVFLDADDMMRDGYLESVIVAWNRTRSIVYTDYIGSYILRGDQRVEDIVGAIGSDPITRTVFTRARLNDYDPERARSQPTDPPYVWCTVTCFMPREWFEKIGGFREDLETWEDWDLFIRLAKAGRPFHHLTEPLLHYRLWTGGRREIGRTNWQELGLFERVGQ